MPLIAGKDILAAGLVSIWSNLNDTVESAADKMGNQCKNFAMTGTPMTMVTGTQAPGQVVNGGVTSTPGTISGSGIGGLDAPAPGMGLDAAKSQLVSGLKAVFSNTNNTAASAADQTATAIFAFLSQAKVMTMVTGTVMPGQPVPPPVGPVGPGAWTGTGMGGLESTSGAGLGPSLSDFVTLIKDTWANTGNSAEDAANSIAAALLEYYKKSKIDSIDLGTAGGGAAVVAPPPAPPSGVTTSPGVATGTGTGTLT